MKYSKSFLFSFFSVVIVFLFSSLKSNSEFIVFNGWNVLIEASDANKQIQNEKGNNLIADFLPTSTTHQIIRHEYYSLSYNEKWEQAEWVAYELKRSYLKNNDFKRPYFIEDPLVLTKSADWRNYKKSGYDKGHLCPAADMGFSLSAYNDTFYTSNIAPQEHGFNAGIWSRLEQKVRYWANKYDGVYVVTGGVLKPNLKTIGQEHVAVPNYFYKIIMNGSKGNYKMIAFLIPNKKSEKSIFDYVVSVDRIEQLSGIDFFPNLDDTSENKLEKSTDIKIWFAK